MLGKLFKSDEGGHYGEQELWQYHWRARDICPNPDQIAVHVKTCKRCERALKRIERQNIEPVFDGADIDALAERLYQEQMQK